MSDNKPFSDDHLRAERGDLAACHMGDAHRLEWRRIAAGLRDAIDASLELDAGVEELARLADGAEALAGQLRVHAKGRGVPLFGGGAESSPEAVSRNVPFSPVMGQLNPLAPPLVLKHAEGEVSGVVELGVAYQGAPGLVHGAVIAALYDEVLALANIIEGAAGPTGRLTIHFRKPTPLHTPLRFRAWCERIDARKVLTHGECYAGDLRVTEAEGVFIRIRNAAAEDGAADGSPSA